MLLRKIGELITETLQIAEDAFVDEADEAKKFEDRILERGRGQ